MENQYSSDNILDINATEQIFCPSSSIWETTEGQLFVFSCHRLWKFSIKHLESGHSQTIVNISDYQNAESIGPYNISGEAVAFKIVFNNI